MGHVAKLAMHDTVLVLSQTVMMLIEVLVMLTLEMWMESRLHLEHKVTIVDICVRWIEDTAILLKCSAQFVPSILVELIEIVAPGELKIVRVLVIVIGLNIVEKDVPWHIFSVKIGSPCVESRRPEVHPQ